MSRVKVELHQKNIQSAAMPATLEIRSNEPILQAANDYDVSLLKYTTGFDVPILHIPEDRPVVFYYLGIPTLETEIKLVNTISMSGSFNSVQDFCDVFNKKNRYKDSRGNDVIWFEMLINQNNILVIRTIQLRTVIHLMVGLNEHAYAMFKDYFKYDQSEVLGFHNFIKNDKGSISHYISDRTTALTTDKGIFYNFDYIQLGTDLPIAQTLTTIRGRLEGQSLVVKMPTLGTITTNSAVQDAYAKGGLLYLPNFQISSSLDSDLPLYSFKITPYLFYKTGYYEKLMLTPESTCYAYIEFTPKAI